MKSKPTLPPALQEEVEWFFEYAPPERLSRNLRKLLLSYLALQQDGHAMNMDDLLTDMQWLFELLDKAGDELKEP